MFIEILGNMTQVSDVAPGPLVLLLPVQGSRLALLHIVAKMLKTMWWQAGFKPENKTLLGCVLNPALNVPRESILMSGNVFQMEIPTG
jgi:hypothetical protein